MTEAMSPELLSQVQLWRAKAVEGTLTLEEQVEAIRLLRAGRLAAVERAKRTRAAGSRTRKPGPSADSVLSQLGIKL